MNKFVHRILSHRTRSAVSSDEMFRDAVSKRVTWLGEFHSEPRIIALQNELVVRLARQFGGERGSGSGGGKNEESRPRLHVVMEHFSVEMQPLLDRFQTDPTFTVEDLEEEYLRVGTEGHALEPYRGFLNFCRGTTMRGADRAAAGEGEGEAPLQDGAFASASPSVDGGDATYCEVLLHGGFIPRPYAARWNKCADLDAKRGLLDEISANGWLPGTDGEKSAAMQRALLSATDEERDALLLRGSAKHYRLVESLMNGQDLYTTVDGNDVDEEEDRIDQSAPLAKLYQAQILKDHAMGFFLANLLLNHASCPLRRNDRYLVLAGFGHVKHYLGVPACLEGYLKAESLYHSDEGRREAAMDVLTNLLGESGRGPAGQIIIGSQMLYEVYLEEKYNPLIEAEAMEDEEKSAEAKTAALFDLYATKLDVMDRLLLESDIVRGPLLNPSAGAGKFGKPCADYLFVYDEDDDNVLPSEEEGSGDSKRDEACGEAAAASSAKTETLEAYDRVGQTAARKGNVAKARAIMLQLGYTEEDLEVVGENDMYNFQGVANPHKVAKIQRGERVLDVGSGLGVDSFLAARACGADGKDYGGDGDESNGAVVVGVDLAPGEVAHANRRAEERGCDPARVRFLVGDAERLKDALARAGYGPASFDACISNGAFCLIPDKRRAFEQVYEALKPGGRMAVSTTTIQPGGKLTPDFEWPVCMRMFVNLDDVMPICEGVGFKNVRIVDAESPLEGIELPEEAVIEEERQRSSGEQRFKIHGKYTNHFKHLEKMNMDELCKVVTVYGEK
mmetsp:Transcript_44958/g.137313  ORF Transcript_44958/g.137313 Transcript_44958/m.137313 type:complete len:789 (-) Transcript_44958:97-2463(-)